MRLVRSDRWFLLVASLLAVNPFTTIAAAAESLHDGPYVTQQANGSWIAQWVEDGDSAPRVRLEQVSVGKRISVPAVGSLPAFDVRMRAAAPIAPDSITLRSEPPLFVVADTHGEYEIVAELLQKHRVVDSSLRWAFGSGHLVILGDMLDRGPNQMEILWLLYELEAQAAEAGGGVHVVLGNHEVMVLTGDLRYLNEKYVRTAQVLGVGSYSELLGARTLLGQWLRMKPAVFKIGNFLCLHGGLSRDVLDRKLTIGRLNAAVWARLNDEPLSAAEQEEAQVVLGRLGPLWYRGYFADQKDFPTATAADVDRTLDVFRVRAVLVGHTIVPSVTPLYDGKVIAVQVYPRRDEKSGQPILEGLLVRDGTLLRASVTGTTEPFNLKKPLP